MADKPILEINDVIPRLSDIAFKEPINWKIRESENWAIVGANGAGKTILTDIITGKYALKSGEIKIEEGRSSSQFIKSVAFKDIYSLADIKNSYYQQRWNVGDEHEMPLVKDLLLKADNQEWVDYLVESFNIADLLEKEINLLSSGELRKFLIIKSLISKPRLLILDNPYIGLDAASRIVLNNVLEKLATMEGIQIILVLSNPDDIPSVITNILAIKDKAIKATFERDEFLNDKEIQDKLFECEYPINLGDVIQSKNGGICFNNVLELKNIHIGYRKRTILKNLDWTVKKGEKWALLGKNGAGKSTLLSLICADNPQAYANDITLFDQKRGNGESIWDIKKRIGYISPEMHLYYQKNVRCVDIVASGFFDTIGLYRKCNDEQEKIAEKWMAVFGVGHLKNHPFLLASSGEQRLMLLARVFVKNPDLLVLDEPLHGLDINKKKHMKSIIEEYCKDDKSLIYVTHYENEIPNIVDKKLTLTKQM
ncbi:ATP-binding cassette domain-containing protein [Dysgonomonas sp. 520]|uniref:ATP-binding cassette domain-containing protein n=1 Tax=Dysgonomonas sp. 520 TaxID=2302931 RepID=UPI0013D7B81E|nr:ATP-binding cassette domain-containing protein [Dysgonomonas sp. 520]NDW08051.1 ATP-binding cassette domain-containing protein [Dysgonomonas sp. 520]